MNNIYLAILLTFLYSAITYAEPTLLVNSDSFTLDKNQNIAVFQTNVIVWFEDMVLQTSKLKIIYKNDGNKTRIDKIIMPSYIMANKTQSGETLVADSAEYDDSSHRLILTGNVVLEHLDNIVRTPKLVYYTAFKRINTM